MNEKNQCFKGWETLVNNISINQWFNTMASYNLISSDLSVINAINIKTIIIVRANTRLSNTFSTVLSRDVDLKNWESPQIRYISVTICPAWYM